MLLSSDRAWIKASALVGVEMDTENLRRRENPKERRNAHDVREVLPGEGSTHPHLHSVIQYYQLYTKDTNTYSLPEYEVQEKFYTIRKKKMKLKT